MSEDRNPAPVSEDTPQNCSTPDSSGLSLLSPRAEWIWLGAILFLALIVRVVNLNSVPLNLMCDEADNLGDCLEIMGGIGPGWYGLDWKPQPAFSVHVMTMFLRVLGIHIWAVRFPSVLFSILALIPFYFLAKRMVSQFAALAATFLLSNGVWYLHFSRSGWENIYVCFFALMAVWLFTIAGEKKRWYLYFAASGFFAGVSALGYFAGRLILPAICLAYPLHLFFHRKEWKKQVLGFLILCFVASIVILPQGLIFLKKGTWELDTIKWGHFNRRSANVFIFNNPEGKGPKHEVIGRQFSRIMRSFFVPTLNNQPRYVPVHKTPIDYATGALFALGMFLSLFYFRKMFVWWSIFLTQVFFTQVLTRGIPDQARGIVMILPIYFFAALSIDLFRSYFTGFAQKKIPITLILMAMLISAYNVNLYFEWCHTESAIRTRLPFVRTEEFPFWLEAQQNRVDRGTKVFNLGEWDRGIRQRSIEQMQQTLPLSRGKDGGLTARIYRNNAWEGRPSQTVAMTPLSIPVDIEGGGYSIKWTGFIEIEEAAKYIFNLRSDDGSLLYIDGKLVVDNGGHHGTQDVSNSVKLDKGSHEIELRYFQDDGAAVLEVTWGLVPGNLVPLPSGVLKPEISRK